MPKRIDINAFDLASKHVDDEPVEDYSKHAPADLGEVRNKELKDRRGR